MFYITDDNRDQFLDFYREDGDQIWDVEKKEGEFGQFYFTFDQKKVYEFYKDYPYALSPEEKAIFDKENSVLAELFGTCAKKPEAGGDEVVGDDLP